MLALAAPPARAAQAHAVVYDGWGTPTAFTLGGRVLEGDAPTAPERVAGKRANLVDNVRALESDEIAGADVAVTVDAPPAAQTFSATTDRDGNFRVMVKDLPRALPAGDLPVRVTVRRLPGTMSAAEATAGTGTLTVRDASAPFFAIVSDVDDTVVKTHVTDSRKLAGTVLLKNAAQLEPVSGAAAAYRAARAAGASAFFYVSGSPQNLHPRIQSFLARHDFPRGPIVLKNLGEEKLWQQTAYKLERIEALLAAMPTMRVVLVGDTGEADPEIFRELQKRHPTRVHGIVMRKTPGTVATVERLAGMTVVDDTYASDDVIARLLR